MSNGQELVTSAPVTPRLIEGSPPMLVAGAENRLDAETPPLPYNHGHVAHFWQSGLASWYGKVFHGRRTASGEQYDMYALTAAHRTLPLGSYVRVTALRDARSVVVRINDRGPYARGRVIDLSYVAAAALGLSRTGTMRVRIESVGKQDSQRVALDCKCTEVETGG
ncbi:Endolytic peptidoglycan transglycosylase RlpA [Paraburkholderia nemoris]|uniref:septal ring lytic transglycosylase RlpA family protein n=1 Tax=Paraburkholderia nemoris TaxID=2793076 RepID=UPI00190B6181|nr:MULTISPECIES: septal ring lytic transglycosylase RlpA family protein [Paraburkholderia]MBK3786328.1 septal ring lytic transglycosylase RlpA family protein [Paraburkholderia aspalathi]CAE6851258.1 Endolytic peptidoglycan transglycosylase RlpA [Paraburkholderia nemoris]